MIEFQPFFNSPIDGKFRAYRDDKTGVVLFIERVFGTHEIYGVLFGAVATSGTSSFYHVYNDLKGSRCIFYQHNDGRICSISSCSPVYLSPEEYFKAPH